jgi:hypothetical protein
MHKVAAFVAVFTALTSVAGAAPLMTSYEQCVPRSWGWFLGGACPDGTSAISRFTGQGPGGDGWAGNADGVGGPSAIPYSAVPSQSAIGCAPNLTGR